MNRSLDLSGAWTAAIDDGKEYEMTLPGTLDENSIGHPDEGKYAWHPEANIGNAGEDFDGKAPIATRFTRKFTYEGPAVIRRRIDYVPTPGKRVFLEVERARVLTLSVDGTPVEPVGLTSISTPYVFELTGRLNGYHELIFVSDNSYPGLPHDAIVYSSAATDETQTNWNGLLGRIRIYEEEPLFISGLQLLNRQDSMEARIELTLPETNSDAPQTALLTLTSAAFRTPVTQEITLSGEASVQTFRIPGIPLADDVRRWDEFEGVLYEATLTVTPAVPNAAPVSKTITFGVRTFGDDGTGRLALNGRRFFLRSEANCAEFPETGYPPMSVESWTGILSRYKAYGINVMRFHSHCPPEAAFTAADRLGMMMQPELSHWNPNDAFEQEESYRYYRDELLAEIRMLANHPSFVMLTFGNELACGAPGHARMSELIALAKSVDDTRLYANASNAHYGALGYDRDSDFFATQTYREHDIRGIFAGNENGLPGFINNEYPNAKKSYDRAMDAIREGYAKPVFSFEVGQFEVLPDFDELTDFHGISDPVNYKLIQRGVKKAGISDADWKRRVEATGEMSRLGYRAEIEAALRTEKLSGISLLGLQDFPGQGTALVGMMNSHLTPKPFAFAKPERFREFFTDALPMVYLDKYTYENTEFLTADIVIANYSKAPLHGDVHCILSDASGRTLLCETVCTKITAGTGRLTKAGTLSLGLTDFTAPARLDLTVSFSGLTNTYPLWIYPPVTPSCPADVYETVVFDEKARAVLSAGGKVYLTPPSEKDAFTNSIRAQFTTDFWSVGTFPAQPGGMGQLIDSAHPLFKHFPTEFYSNWQWWPMANRRAVILPEAVKAIVTEMDSYAKLRPMAKLFEARVGNGRLLFSSIGLQDLKQYPEARALLSSIYRYMAGDEFAPEQTLTEEFVNGLLSK